MTTRRQFLGRSVAGLSFVSLAGAAPGLLARAAEDAVKADRNDHVLIVVELTGGNDGLNTVIPFEDALYYKNRRTLGIPKNEVVRLSDSLGLHPKLAPMAELFKEGKLAVVQGVGYPKPDRSHFRSMEIWHTASVAAAQPTTGWLGRSLDSMPRAKDATLRGLSLTEGLPQALQAEASFVPVVAQLEALTAAANDPKAKLRRELSTQPGATKGPVGHLRRQAETLYLAADRLKAANDQPGPSLEYPESDLGAQLQKAARIVAANLGVRVLYASQDGYDTHASQAETHGQLLEELAGAMATFEKDLSTRKLADKVVVMIFSEFGRRVDENASQGTDHGAASCLMLAGSPIQGGILGKHPSLATLGEGDLIHHTDFRSVYASLLDGWLGCLSKEILGAEFAKLAVLKG
ncbi:MAG: hypothetical protein JWN86_4352 [Planctomycetota bacterium]|nr:hypothetical protein [Planctomycetota bacterium]